MTHLTACVGLQSRTFFCIALFSTLMLPWKDWPLAALLWRSLSSQVTAPPSPVKDCTWWHSQKSILKVVRLREIGTAVSAKANTWNTEAGHADLPELTCFWVKASYAFQAYQAWADSKMWVHGPRETKRKQREVDLGLDLWASEQQSLVWEVLQFWKPAFESLRATAPGADAASCKETAFFKHSD